MIGFQKWLDSLIDMLMSGRTSVLFYFNDDLFFVNMESVKELIQLKIGQQENSRTNATQFL